MGATVPTREAVAERLAGLQENYGSLTVNQTTVTLPPDRFRSVANRYTGGLVDAYVAVENPDEEILHVVGDDGLELPGIAPDEDQSLERGARRAVEQETGVRCGIDDVREVTIAGIRNADGGETLYRLVVVFSADFLEGPVETSAEWAEGLAEVAPVHV